MSRLIRSTAFSFVGLIATMAAAQSSAPADACSLLTNADATAALGEGATGPKAKAAMSDGAGGTVSSCQYTGSGTYSIQLNLQRLAASSVPMYKSMCAQKGTDGLANLGDVACWYNDKHTELNVIKGTALVSIELRRSGNPTEPIKAAMKNALARLK